MYSIRDGLALDDVLLVPQYSTVQSRSDVDTSVEIKGFQKYNHPIIPANMQTITGLEMANAVTTTGGLAIVHRFMDFKEQIDIASKVNLNYVGFSVGVKSYHKECVDEFVDAGVNILCIDIAHGDSRHGIGMLQWMRRKYPDLIIIAGNVATKGGAKRMWDHGANIVKAGIGGGSLCSTRIETANGVPQLTALIDAAEAKEEFKDVYLIADGGLKNAGDVVKCLCFADFVMMGNVFAGCTETPGTILSINGKTCKEYKGSSTHKANHIEGVTSIVATKGKFNSVLTKLLEGVRSGCSYQNSHNLIELKDNPEFIRISNSGLVESRPHNLG